MSTLEGAAGGEAARTGALLLGSSYRSLGSGPRFDYWRCSDCDTEFPYMPERFAIMCNGARITLCPWCRPDSEPWKNGRGA